MTFPQSGSTEALVLLREDAIQKWRRMMGPTKVYKSWRTDPYTIRGTWGLTDTRNTTHGSGKCVFCIVGNVFEFLWRQPF